MKEITVNVAVAFDGTEFYGENRKNECKEYEKNIIKDIENYMCGHVIIHHKELLLGYDHHDTYIYFIDETGKELFIKWCNANNVNFVCENINSVELNKWFHIYDVYHDGYVYKLSGTSLDDIIINYNKLYHTLNDKGKRHINGEEVESPFISR